LLEKELLRLLKTAQEPISGEALSKKLEISRVSVWKRIQKLLKEGYPIKVTKKGYLLERKDLLLEEELAEITKDSRLFKRVYLFFKVSSTMDVAKELLEKRENAIVIAETQSAGRGRLGRSWESDLGGLWFTLLLIKPLLSLKEAYLLTYLSAVSLAQTLIESLQIPARLKWPNDVLLQGKKVAGILLEVKAELDTLEYALIGIGLNVNNKVSEKNFLQPSLSLSEYLNREIERASLLKAFIKNFEILYFDKKERILSLWRSLSDTLGKRVKIITSQETLTGLALDLDEEGNLLLKTKDGLRRVFSGDCFHLRDESN